uniref:Uncharacterized protein n=1 Tax=Avena sativa TaxID=4498 RepID=A0ACD5X342_AVESA
MSHQPFTLATTTTPAAAAADAAAAKPNPTYFQSAPVSQDTIQQKEVLLHLYAYQHLQGKPNGNQKVIVDPNLPHCFGTLATNDWTIYDSPADGPDANIVARAQGLHLGTDMAKENWFICFNMVFVDQRFTGSSFKVMGDFQADEGEWAIVGGTGEFAYAQGVITYKKTQLASGNQRELHVRALCLSLSKPAPQPEPIKPVQIPVTMIGPWGGKSGDILDVPAMPRRLESVTICHDTYVESLAFSFIDQAGKKHTAGPWGAKYGQHKETIEFAPSEFVTQVYGTMRYGENTEKNVIASLKIVTNVKTYGPFGIPNTTTFNVPVYGDDSIVGFFARAGSYVEALGVYVSPSRSH